MAREGTEDRPVVAAGCVASRPTLELPSRLELLNDVGDLHRAAVALDQGRCHLRDSPLRDFFLEEPGRRKRFILDVHEVTVSCDRGSQPLDLPPQLRPLPADAVLLGRKRPVLPEQAFQLCLGTLDEPVTVLGAVNHGDWTIQPLAGTCQGICTPSTSHRQGGVDPLGVGCMLEGSENGAAATDVRRLRRSEGVGPAGPRHATSKVADEGSIPSGSTTSNLHVQGNPGVPRVPER